MSPPANSARARAMALSAAILALASPTAFGAGAGDESAACTRGNPAPAPLAASGVVLMQLNPGELGRTRSPRRRGGPQPNAHAQQVPEDEVKILEEKPLLVVPEDGDLAALAEIRNQVLDLKEMIRALQHSVDAQQGCCSGCGGGGDPHENVTIAQTPGLCATFGDPHFATFDGAHTILLRELTLWLVKSERVWLQAFAQKTTGNLMGIAAGGPFMQGHSIILYNSTEHGGLRALYDGQPILEDSDGEGNAVFNGAPFSIWAARRKTWDMSMNDKNILEIDPAVNFSVAAWPDRFRNSPEGGLFLFRLPEGIEITASGVDFMSAVVKMLPQIGGQTGYCGNFNGIAEDEFDKPPEGSVPPVLMDAWNVPVGEGLDPVEEKDNLFLRANETVALVHPYTPVTLAQLGDTPLLAECVNERLAQAEAGCEGVRDLFMWKSCVVDTCLTGNHHAAQDSATAEILAVEMNRRGIPIFVGHGRCQDMNGEAFRGLVAGGVRSFVGCKHVLRELASVKGVLGAQLQVGGGCEVLAESEEAVKAAEAHHVPKGGWAPASAEGASGHGFVSGVAPDLSWSCWRLN